MVNEGERLWLAAPNEACGLRRVPVMGGGKPEACRQPGPAAVTRVSLDRIHQRLYYSAEMEQIDDIGWMRLPALATH